MEKATNLERYKTGRDADNQNEEYDRAFEGVANSESVKIPIEFVSRAEGWLGLAEF